MVTVRSTKNYYKKYTFSLHLSFAAVRLQCL